MSTNTLSLKTFLATAKDALAALPAQRPLPLTFVVGNESADLDSLCSAIVVAYLQSHLAPGRLHIPLSNLPREDLALRSELGLVLRQADLDTSDLITLSELPQDLDPGQTEWVLVDHNALTGDLQRYESRVVGCIDHHVDEGTVSVQAAPRVIEASASCMSLVVDTYAEDWRVLAHGTQSPIDTKNISKDLHQLALIALAPILIDTANLIVDPKVLPKDRRAAKLLEGELMHDPWFEKTKYYDAVMAAKKDLSKLSLRGIFRKDYKEWENGGVKLGISCAVQNFDFLLEKAAAAAAPSGGDGRDVLLRELQSWAQDQKLDIASIMTTSHPGDEFQRHLLVWGLTRAGTKAVKRFTEDSADKLKLTPWKGGVLDEQGSRYAWQQLAVGASRKQVAPLLREAMEWAGANL